VKKLPSANTSNPLSEMSIHADMTIVKLPSREFPRPRKAKTGDKRSGQGGMGYGMTQKEGPETFLEGNRRNRTKRKHPRKNTQDKIN